MAKFPSPAAYDPPWSRLATICEHLDAGEVVPPDLARWLSDAITRAANDPDVLIAALGLRKSQGRPPTTWDHPDAPAAFLMLWQAVNGPFLGKLGEPSHQRLSPEAAIKTVLEAFQDANGDIFTRSTLQRWLADARHAQAEAENG